MVLEVIYIVRHGFRANFALDPHTGIYSSSVVSPTGLPADVPLVSYGEDQARQLADHLVTLEPAVSRIYSSPYCRCLQTLAPAVAKLREAGVWEGRVRGENGIGEWFGSAPFAHPAPASPQTLHALFPFYDPAYVPILTPPASGESIGELHERVAFVLARIIAELDADPRKPRSVLLCTHAAPLIAIGRVLTGRMPERVEEEDFRPYTAGLSVFVRRSSEEGDGGVEGRERGEDDGLRTVDWRGGKGVGGGWDCVCNGDCSFLKGGEERGWHFSGDEAFLDRSTLETRHLGDGHGADAGAGRQGPERETASFGPEERRVGIREKL